MFELISSRKSIKIKILSMNTAFVSKSVNYTPADTVMTEKKHRVFLKKGVAHIAVDLMDIVCFYYESKVVFALVKDGNKYVTENNLTELEKILNPGLFFRANRRYIINGSFIKNFRTVNQVKLQAELDFGRESFSVLISQKRVSKFRSWIFEL